VQGAGYRVQGKGYRGNGHRGDGYWGNGLGATDIGATGIGATGIGATVFVLGAHDTRHKSGSTSSCTYVHTRVVFSRVHLAARVITTA
jgi:hypothetical protein